MLDKASVVLRDLPRKAEAAGVSFINLKRLVLEVQALEDVVDAAKSPGCKHKDHCKCELCLALQNYNNVRNLGL